MTVETSSRPAPFHKKLDASLTQLGQALAGGILQTITKAIFNHDGLKKHVMHKVTDLINVEITELCKKSATPPSLFRQIPTEKLSNFKWSECIAELQLKAPMLLEMVSTLVSCNDNRNKGKRGDAHHPGICMAIAILMKERNREMCGIQTLLSLVLFTSRAQKQVCTVCYN